VLMVGGSLLSDWPMRLRPIRWRRRGGSTPPCAETLAAREPVPGARSDGGVARRDAAGAPRGARAGQGPEVAVTETRPGDVAPQRRTSPVPLSAASDEVAAAVQAVVAS
jgi:hypothetical protein